MKSRDGIQKVELEGDPTSRGEEEEHLHHLVPRPPPPVHHQASNRRFNFTPATSAMNRLLPPTPASDATLALIDPQRSWEDARVMVPMKMVTIRLILTWDTDWVRRCAAHPAALISWS